MVWEPVNHEGDSAVKFALLSLQLELVDLADVCLHCFMEKKNSDAYHYLLAVSHYKRSEFNASIDHLNSMVTRDDQIRRWSLLKAHNDYGVGRIQEAVVRYVGLSFSPTQLR